MTYIGCHVKVWNTCLSESLSIQRISACVMLPKNIGLSDKLVNGSFATVVKVYFDSEK